jgi:cell division protein FtsB
VAVAADGVAHAAPVDVSVGELMALKAEQTRLAAEVEQLKAQLRKLADDLGASLG